MTIVWTGHRAVRNALGGATTSAGRPTTRSTGPNWYRFQDVNVWKDLGPKFVLQAWRDVPGRPATGQPRGELANPRGGSTLLAAHDLRTATACRTTTGSPTRPTTPGRWRVRAPTGSLWLGVPGGRGDRPASSAETRARRPTAPGSNARQASFERRLWEGDHYRLRRRRRAIGQHHGRPARRPVVRRRDRPGRPRRARPRPGGAADDPRPQRRGFAGGRSGAVNGTRPGRLGGPFERTVAGSLGGDCPTPSRRS